jgi:hypothetical protein
MDRSRYYYAGGNKIELTLADDLAVLDTTEDPKGRPSSPQIGRALTGGLRLISAKEYLKLHPSRAEKAKYPVYRSHGAIVIAMPEVRVEDSRKEIWTEFRRWLAKHKESVTVVSRDDDGLILKPASGSGADALDLANDLAEVVRPEMAQARFLRVTPRPGTYEKAKNTRR